MTKHNEVSPGLDSWDKIQNKDYGFMKKWQEMSSSKMIT